MGILTKTLTHALLWFTMGLTLTGCASLPAGTPAHNKVVDWEVRRAQLSDIRTWVIRGALSIRTPEKRGTVSVYWAQSGEQFTLRLFGPLGAGSVRIEGNGGEVTLKDSKGRTQTAPTPEALLQKTLGWQLPIREMVYWIRSLPAPAYPAAITLDKVQRTKQFHQRGWTIQYLRYTAVKQQDLPSIMTLARKDIQIKFILRKWDI